jgi:ribose-phosphate pyrophosphokinase
MPYELKLFTGNANRALAEEIAASLGTTLGQAEVSRFSDGEIFVQIDENIRGADAFIVQPTCPPVNDSLMELLIMLDAFKRASAQRITAVLPYYGYARQDRKVQSRMPISAKLVADLITAAGAHRVLALDLHAGQIQGFFNIPVDHLFAAPVMIDYIAKLNLSDPVVVSPDAGGVERARAIAKRLHAGLAIIDKRRDGPNVAVFMHLIGDVKGRDAVIIDDMIDTAGTLVQAADALKREGARRILACGVHPVLSGPAMARRSRS